MRSKFQRIGTEVAIVLAIVIGVRAYQTRAHPQGTAPRAHARLLDGTEVELGGPSDEPVAIHFWATWCGVCRAEESNVVHLAANARVLTVASRSGDAESIRRYMQARGLDFAVIEDASGRLASKYGVQAYPTTFFVARDGGIRTSEVGYTTTLGLRVRMWFAGL